MPTLKPATPDFLDNAPFRIISEVTVAAPVDACWALLADQTSWNSWFDGMKLVDATPSVWTEPGQTRVVKVNGLKVHETAISVVPEQEYAFTINKWPLPTAAMAAEGVRLEAASIGDSPSTKLTYIGAFESTKIGSFVEKLLTKQMGTAWTTALTTMGTLAAKSAG